LQQKFLEGAALQCGVCTPGFIVAAKALLEHNPRPTEADARRYLAGNLCRCTGYDKIIRAVLDAAEATAPAKKEKAKRAARKKAEPAEQPAAE
jgi:carbon-monoxide dehydrogenase small subunit